MEVRLANDRGRAEHGWLTSRHSFSFGRYYDPQHMAFSDLRVINDDHVQPACGFDTHGHRDMEIFTYVLEGALEHQDSMGNGSVIRPGDVQMMSAGTGVKHSEFNASRTEEVHFLQIWIEPNQIGVVPRYQQQHFPAEDKRGQLRLIISPEGEQDSLGVYQDVRVYAGLFSGQEAASIDFSDRRYVYAHLARGALCINGHTLHAGDALKLRYPEHLEISQGQDAELLVFDLRPEA